MRESIKQFIRQKFFPHANPNDTFRKAVKEADRGPLKLLRTAYQTYSQASMPAPRGIWEPIWYTFQYTSSIKQNVIRAAWVTPLYQTLCKEIGPGFVSGAFAPFVNGKGNIYFGSNVKIMGKVDYFFPSIKETVPELHVGSHTHIGHNVSFVVADRITIGEHCLIASQVRFRDSNGHSMDPEARRRGAPPDKHEIKPIVIGKNVWIGNNVNIMPGVHIGDNCVIAAGTTVRQNIPSNHLVIPGPSKVMKMRDLTKMRKPQVDTT